jgi:hypothetical protein
MSMCATGLEGRSPDARPPGPDRTGPARPDFDSILRVDARGDFVQAGEAFRAVEAPGGGAIASITSIASVSSLVAHHS